MAGSPSSSASPACREGVQWFKLREKVCRAAPALDPPRQHWLESDPSESFCRECAIRARGKEFELGPPLKDDGWALRTPLEDAFFDGVGAYGCGCPGHSDSPESCSGCGVTLDHWLTDYGISEEIVHWANSEMSENLSEVAYSIDRLFECKDEDRDAVRAIAERFLTHAAAHNF